MVTSIDLKQNWVCVICFVALDMDKSEEAVVSSTTEVDKEQVADIGHEKFTSKRQLKLQKRREEWLSRKPEKR